MARRVEIRAPDYTGECAAVVSYWHRRVGDSVRQGQDLLEYETDKATITLESPCDGTVAEILLDEDAQVRAGDLLGIVVAQ